MQLNVRDVASILRVPENAIYRWVRSENLPASNVCGEYRFNPAELVEWASVRDLDISPEFLQNADVRSQDTPNLAAALRSGGILPRVSGQDKAAAVEEIVQALLLPDGFDRTLLVEALLAREAVGCTEVGDGIAIPHPRYPLILPVAQPALTLCFLQPPLVLTGREGTGVEMLFLLVSPTMRAHVCLVARLASALHDVEFRELIKRRGSHDHIFRAAERLGSSQPRPN